VGQLSWFRGARCCETGGQVAGCGCRCGCRSRVVVMVAGHRVRLSDIDKRK
jgi:hypothetical protein